MKYLRKVLFFLAACCFTPILSCSDNNSDPSDPSPVYDFRTTFQVQEEFYVQGRSERLLEVRSKTRGHGFLHSDQVRAGNALPVFSLQESADLRESYSFEYDTKNDLYWTKATGKDDAGNTIYTGLQTLDDAGFPSRCIWYDASGGFFSASETTYDETLYLMTSIIYYLNDPTDNPDAKKDYEYSLEWNSDGIRTVRNETGYDANGLVTYTFRWRSVIVENALRGAFGRGYYEYYGEYDAGTLIYQEKCAFGSDGFPETFSFDNNGDGIYEETYQAEIGKTVEGYLSSLVASDESTGEKAWKSTFIYDPAGRLKTLQYYEMLENEFALIETLSFVWYQNPVNGPTGGIEVDFLSDEEGNPLGEYETIEWTAAQRTHRHYSAPGAEARRITDTLEKIIVQ